MSDVYIVEAVRTPVGKYKGSLAGVRADHLGAHLLGALLARAGVDAAEVDDVILGCVTQVGEQSANIARTSVLGAGWPAKIPGLTIDRKCGSGEVAVHMAAGLIAAGSADVVVAGGAENMSRVRMGGNREIYGEAFGALASNAYELTSQGEAAERVADQWKLGREQLDAYAAESHRRAAAASAAGWFEREIVEVPVAALKDAAYAEPAPDSLSADETIRPGTNVEKLATLKTSFRADGKLTAGNSSQISDGAAVLLLMSGAAVDRLRVKPRARIRAFTTVGSDPTLMLTGPVAATRKVLAQAGLGVDDIDLFEVNEAFAPVPLMWAQELGVSHDKLNVNGGAIALGHPLGASGARIMTSLLHELERRGARYGLQAICCAGGMGTATLIERL
ncbi:thiolase family protein [Massilia yuzhufengensis]|uniref:Acetyl-CoA acyltransferase n=1 Tax=Massilia yuzhufengensis TaxID=1164594 RepID=A0A1I1IYA0_9BURK|nr:thiolase family protein [Massilia yuzhufengensis]SFC40861.1 acetyl-CoA acyltransferase [Massilia yuzhufengensis]